MSYNQPSLVWFPVWRPETARQAFLGFNDAATLEESDIPALPAVAHVVYLDEVFYYTSQEDFEPFLYRFLESRDETDLDKLLWETAYDVFDDCAFRHGEIEGLGKVIFMAETALGHYFQSSKEYSNTNKCNILKTALVNVSKDYDFDGCDGGHP